MANEVDGRNKEEIIDAREWKIMNCKIDSESPKKMFIANFIFCYLFETSNNQLKLTNRINVNKVGFKVGHI